MSQISEQKRLEIQKQAQEILYNFSKSLQKISIKRKEIKAEIGGFREEGAGTEKEMDFRKRMFENAPIKNENNIVAEKKKW